MASAKGKLSSTTKLALQTALAELVAARTVHGPAIDLAITHARIAMQTYLDEQPEPVKATDAGNAVGNKGTQGTVKGVLLDDGAGTRSNGTPPHSVRKATHEVRLLRLKSRS